MKQKYYPCLYIALEGTSVIILKVSLFSFNLLQEFV